MALIHPTQIFKSSPKALTYARKSSENEDREVQSIDGRVNRLKKLAKERA